MCLQYLITFVILISCKMLLGNELNNHKLCTYYIYIFYFNALYSIMNKSYVLNY